MKFPSVLFATMPLLAVAAPLSAQERVAGEAEVIVVTGQTLAESERALEECLARGCPPEEDIRLSLAHAENQFVEGIYRDGQRTLRASIRRTDDAAERLPVPVAGLYRASARFAEHLGEGKDFQLATLDMKDTLEDGLGRDHWRVLVADIAVGDSRAKLGIPEDAERIYKRVERRAIDLDQPRIAMFARVRQALLLQARFEGTKQQRYEREAIELLTDIRDNPLPGGEEFTLLAQVALARLLKDNDEGGEAIDQLVRSFAEQGGTTRPVLLYSAPLYTDEDLDRLATRSNNASARLSTLSRNKPVWADIGYWINSDGKVEEFEILRNEGGTEWLEQVARHVKSRVYAPVSDDAVQPGFYIVERYTYTARYADQTTGSRLRRREPVPRIERIDLTPENYAPPIANET